MGSPVRETELFDQVPVRSRRSSALVRAIPLGLSDSNSHLRPSGLVVHINKKFVSVVTRSVYTALEALRVEPRRVNRSTKGVSANGPQRANASRPLCLGTYSATRSVVRCCSAFAPKSSTMTHLCCAGLNPTRV